MATPAAAQGAATDTGAGGQYTIPTGNVTVVWPAGWTVVGQNDMNIGLINASQTIPISIQATRFDGNTWDQEAAFSVERSGGLNTTVTGPVVTDNGFMYTTDDAQLGQSMVNAFASSDPLVYVRVLAYDIMPGEDLTPLAAEANGITANGVPILQGIEAVIPPSTAAAAFGQYTIPTGNVHVAWPAGWSVVSQNNDEITLTNASQTMVLDIAGVEFTATTWNPEAAIYQGLYFDDQGANATITGPVVTNNGFMLTTDGQYGPRMINAFASRYPPVYVLVLAHTIQPGADLAALAAEANGVTANGVPVLQGIEAVIPPAA